MAAHLWNSDVSDVIPRNYHSAGSYVYGFSCARACMRFRCGGFNAFKVMTIALTRLGKSLTVMSMAPSWLASSAGRSVDIDHMMAQT